MAGSPGPAFVTVTVAGALVLPPAMSPNVDCVGVTVTPVALALPARATDCGLPGASSVTLNVALSLPPACGVKVTASAHEPPTATARPLQPSLETTKTYRLGAGDGDGLNV